MSVSHTYYGQRVTIIQGRIERLRSHVERAWNMVRYLEASAQTAQEAATQPRAQQARIVAASMMADRLEEHVKRLHIARNALLAEIDE
jgi:hypothetical protein